MTEKAHELEALRSQSAAQLEDEKKTLQGVFDQQLAAVRNQHEKDLQHMKGKLTYSWVLLLYLWLVAQPPSHTTHTATVSWNTYMYEKFVNH